jgi:hypothetical protein
VAACYQWANERERSRGKISSSMNRQTQPPLAPDMVDDVADVPRTLSAPIASCVVRSDTEHPVFHGCIDWHSAVHGNYSLRVIARLTGDKQFGQVAQSVISTDGLRSELSSVNAGQLGQELPYGFAWLLILDREAGLGDMAPLAVAVSSQLRQWIMGHVEGDELKATEYQNLSFPVFALHRWYLRFAPEQAATFRRVVVSALATRWRESCLEDSRQITGFFDPCANLLLALSDSYAADPTVVDHADLTSLLDAVTAVPPLAPGDLPSIHAAGLNFSRSWAIYMAAMAIGRKQLLEVADQYFFATYNAPEQWRENYHSYSHWVAQFGVHALDLRDQAQQRLLRLT